MTPKEWEWRLGADGNWTYLVTLDHDTNGKGTLGIKVLEERLLEIGCPGLSLDPSSSPAHHPPNIDPSIPTFPEHQDPARWNAACVFHAVCADGVLALRCPGVACASCAWCALHSRFQEKGLWNINL